MGMRLPDNTVPSTANHTNGRRKLEHLHIASKHEVEPKGVTTGLDEYQFIHQALPEIDLAAIDLSTALFGKELNAPLVISSMVGGIDAARQINRNLFEGGLKTMNGIEEQLSRIEPSQRVLLLSHCLRPSKTCPGKYGKQGLECPSDCNEDCSNGRLRRLAIRLGYKAVCIAPGGRLAIRFVKESSPQGIVAVACQKELEEGVQGVKELAGDAGTAPLIVVVPLTKDGCVDTEVNEELALEIIALGCTLHTGEGRA